MVPIEKLPFVPRRATNWLRHLIQGVNWTILYKDRKKGVRITIRTIRMTMDLVCQVYVETSSNDSHVD